ncbi:hypothetical protein ACQKJC_08690 [Priestia koreensis]|uniref:hypothetical protein n=1 Tax=Priestia koreensis TaxID=284581 RepID=UPI003D054E9F
MPRKPKEYKVTVIEVEMDEDDSEEKQYEFLKDWIYKFLFTGEYRKEDNIKEVEGEANAKKAKRI